MLKNWLTADNVASVAETVAIILVSLSIFYKKLKQDIKKYGKDKNAVASNIQRQSCIDLEISTKMRDALEYLEVDRLMVMEFHNGEHYANGREALRCSCTYEVCRYGKESIKSKLQGLALSMFPEGLRDLFNEKCLYSNSLIEIKDKYPSIHAMFKQFKVKSHYAKLLLNDKQQPIGYIAAYDEDDRDMSKIESEVINKLAFFIEEKIKEMSY